MEFEKLEEKINTNANRIEDNMQKIHQNTGALEILKTFKSDSNKFFIMWIITFIALVGSLLYIVYLLNDISSVEIKQRINDVETIGGDVVNNGND